MDKQEFSTSNECQMLIGCNEHTDSKELNVKCDESSACDCNAWLHLKTITTFNSGVYFEKNQFDYVLINSI